MFSWNTAVTKKPLLEVAPTTLTQRFYHNARSRVQLFLVEAHFRLIR